LDISTATAQRTETVVPGIAYTRQSEFIAGMRATIPLIVGAIPFGIIFGAIAATSRLSPVAALAMSAFVFAGSAQFISLGLIAGGATIPLIVLTTLVVNLRHALYGATLGPYMKQLPQRWLAPLGFWLTDESFVIAVQRYERADESPHKHWFLFGSELWMYLNWQLCTVIGLVAGQSIPNPASWGLDFAMTVTFTGMVIPMIRNRPLLVAVAVAGVTAVLANSLPNKLGLMVAALFGVIAGVVAEQWKERSA
jgi:4-azaleucine resistance transporter AzlC